MTADKRATAAQLTDENSNENNERSAKNNSKEALFLATGLNARAFFQLNDSWIPDSESTQQHMTANKQHSLSLKNTSTHRSGK